MRKPKEVILAAHITFYRHQERSHGSVTLEEFDNPNNEPQQVERDVQRVIETDLPRELEELFGLEVKTRFIAVRSGSLVAFFAVAASAVGVFSSYSDFFESIELVKRHSAALLQRVLEKRYAPRPSFSAQVAVSTQYPRLPDPDDVSPARWWRKHMGHLPPGFPSGSAQPPARDGLFWWLLISNVLLATALGAMVAAAVIKTYFL